MAPGNNRDYMTHARRVSANLARHAARMKELMETGMTREDASRQAYEEIRNKKRGEKEIA